MQGIGSQLKQTRESKGYTLEMVQESTKIHMEYLRALENDQFDTLPSPFYVRAFLRTYAHSLGLDAQPLLDYYERSATSSRMPRRGIQPQGRSVQGGPSHGQASRDLRPQPRIGRTYAPRSQRMTQPQREGMMNTQNHRPLPQQQPNVPNQAELQQSTQQQQSFASSSNLPPNQERRGSQPRMGTQQPQQATGQFRAVTTDQQTMQSTQKMPTLAQQSQPAGEVNQSTSSVPAVSQATMVPRRVQQEVKRGILQGDGDPTKKKNKKRNTWMVRVAAVGALLLVTAGALTSLYGGSADQPAPKGKNKEVVAESASNSTVSAKTPDSTTITKVETGKDIEGDLYTLKGAKKVEIEIKAIKGESGLTYGTKTNNQKENFTLKVGDKRSIDGDKFIWFRLFKPSNTEIKVNGEEIDTTAQDVPKSYRIKLSK
ncbi:helix-turn-helix domain-containing protein [Marininema halotolerans]|uniref:Protein RodZ, contains Xre-like HTH and DUF4115 domains n=1 Tax=Marininema halotolerans TaxID=1155944 RepID=A0A1I6R5Y2_9BACL|nr:helix-turn-helix transcriptional regulator [Marininema halotolerans]SFS60086.1 protein RodZ, contains Xre-like HTH and DUF4115 domains [Marininema halotolerans]